MAIAPLSPRQKNPDARKSYLGRASKGNCKHSEKKEELEHFLRGDFHDDEKAALC